MLYGKRFVICGLNRLAGRVARALLDERAEVTIIYVSGVDSELGRRFATGATIIEDSRDIEESTLKVAGIANADCLLALADLDLDNLRTAVIVSKAAPTLPVVIRSFDPVLADQMEQGINIRRAYSMSALAAPAFVAAACGEEVLETLRLGEGETPICRVVVRTGSPLLGLNVLQVKARFGCAVVACTEGEHDWRPMETARTDRSLIIDDQILVGGPLPNVLGLIAHNVGFLRDGRRPRIARPPRQSPKTRRLPPARLLWVGGALLALLVVSVLVFGIALHLRPVDAIYFVITTATTTGYGDINLEKSPDWLKLFGNLVMLSGGALLGIVFSYLAALATTERLDEIMGQRAGRMAGHVVVAGLGNLGYRVARSLLDLGMEVAVIELSSEARYADAISTRAPVLAGDARLSETLDRAGVSHAVAFIACTNDDLVNVQACLHARRLNPNIRTVARVYDDLLAESLPQTFAIDRALSASRVASGAFVGAATDGQALRLFRIGTLDFIACRYTANVLVPESVIVDWRSQGVRLLAYHPTTGELLAPSKLTGPLLAGDETILCGPADAVKKIMSVTSVDGSKQTASMSQSGHL